MASKEMKLLILQEIEKRKDVLFGNFSETLRKEDKVKLWKEIYDTGKSCGMFRDKEWSYIRDVFWPNLRKTTIHKIDNAKKTGTGGGSEAKLTDIDNKVLDIIGKQSPNITSLNVSETAEFEIGLSEHSSGIEPSTSTAQPTLNSTCNDIRVKKTHKKRKLDEAESEVEEMKKEKLALQLDFLKLKNHKLALEVMELEARFGFAQSEIASKYYTLGSDIFNSNDTDESSNYVYSNNIDDSSNYVE